MKTIIAQKKLSSLNAGERPIRAAVLAYVGVIRSVAEALGSEKVTDPFGSNAVKLVHPQTTPEDAASLIKTAVKEFSFRSANKSKAKYFNIVVYDGQVSFEIDGLIRDGVIPENSLTVITQ